MWCEIVLAAIFYMTHSYLVVAGASINQRSIAYVWAMTIFAHSMGLSASFVSCSVNIFLIEATRAIWRQCVDINQRPAIFRQDNLDSTPWRTLHIFTVAKVAQIIWSVPGPLVSFLYHAAAVWKVFLGRSNIYIGHCCDAQHVSIKSNLEICSPWKF